MSQPVVTVIANSVNISHTVATALFEAQDYEMELWSDVHEVTRGGRLTFWDIYGKGYDWLNDNEHLTSVLTRFQVHGEIGFIRLYDIPQSFMEPGRSITPMHLWGYRFDGKGGMVRVEGVVQWSERQS